MRAYRYLLCITLAVTVVINAILHVAKDTLDALVSFLTTLCGVLIFFHFSILFSANAKTHSHLYHYAFANFYTHITVLRRKDDRYGSLYNSRSAPVNTQLY